MADPVTPEAEEPQAITPEPGEAGTPEEVNEYQKRYEDLRPQYDRTMQELQQLRTQQEALASDPEAQRAFLATLGYEVEEPVSEFADDPVAALRQEFATLKEQWQTEQQAATAQAEMAQAIQAGEAHVAQEFQAIERADLTDEDQAWIVSRALSLPADQSGMPDIKTAYKEFEAFEERRMKQWAASKRTTHRVSPSGGAGERVPDTAKHDGRVEMMMTRLQDAAS